MPGDDLEDCTNCDGRGYSPVEFYRPDGTLAHREKMTCPICMGIGKV